MSSVTAVPLRPVKRSYLIYLWIGIALAVIGAVALARQGDDFLTRNARVHGVVTTASGLQYKVIAPGAPGAARPTDSDVALITYEGKLLNGTTFDKSQQPTPMPVAGVVPGFSEALKLMPKGSHYRVWMKPSLAYGDHANGPIPASSTLMFDITLLDFLPVSVVQQIQAQQQMQMQRMQGAPAGAAAPGMSSPTGMPGRSSPQ